MSRPLVLVAAFGIATAIICLPLAAALHVKSGDPDGWRWNGSHWKLTRTFGWEFGGDDAGGANSAYGALISREFSWTGGDSLRLDVPADVHFKPAPTWHLSIRGRSDTLDRLELNNDRISLPSQIFDHSGPLNIELSGPALRRVAIEGSGEVVLEDLNQDRLRVAISGSGSAHASGKVDDLAVDIAGSGDAALEKLAASSATVSIAGSGSADITPADSADISIAGSGDVRLHSRPKHVNSRVAGSGSVITDASNPVSGETTPAAGKN